MKIGFAWAAQSQGQDAVQTGPTGQDQDHQGWFTWDTFQKVITSIVAGYNTEHNDDDTHSTIHATGKVFERDRTTAVGDWILVPYVSTNFSAQGSMTWTVQSGDVLVNQYTLVGSTMCFQFEATATSVGGVADVALVLIIPGAFSAGTGTQWGTYHYVDNGTHGIGVWAAATTGTGINILFYKTDYTTNWAGAANTTEIRASGAFQLSLNS